LPKMTIKELNEKISIISRVVHPKYRTIGLGVKLVRETLSLAGTPYVEMIAVMAKYNPFGEKAGMQKIMASKPNPNLLHTIEQLRVLGFNPVMLGSINYNVQKIRLAGKDRVRKILEELSRKGGVLRKRLMSLHRVYPKHEEFVEKMSTVNEKGLAAILKRINFLAQTKIYLFWKHLEKLESFGVE
jgi:hypothetical protein